MFTLFCYTHLHKRTRIRHPLAKKIYNHFWFELVVPGLLGMTILNCCHQELFCEHEDRLLSYPTVNQAGKDWDPALMECQSLDLTAETGLVERAVVRAGLSVRVPACMLQWVPTNCCQGMAHVITSVFLEPQVGEEAVLPANIHILKCLLPVEQGVVYIHVVHLGGKDQWPRPKTVDDWEL